VGLEVGRRRHDRRPEVGRDPDRDHVALDELTDLDPGVEPRGDDVDRAVVGGDVEDDVRVLAGETGESREEHHRRSDPRHDQAQPPGRPFPQAAHAVERRLDVAQCGTDLREELVSRFGGRDASRRPGQQADAEALLEAPASRLRGIPAERILEGLVARYLG